MRIISLLFICLCLCRGALGDTTKTTCPRSQTDPFFHLRSEVACPLIHGRELHSDAKDNIVSFEDWKKIREDVVEATESDTTVDTTVGNVTDQPPPVVNVTNPPPPVENVEVKRPVNRYNYASPDCSARIHSASALTQHASSLLHKSRDRYMLTPCKADEHWVVIELCDEIRIEAIEISLWEFYSGVVRDIRVSAGDDEDAKSFEPIASFVGRNIRGAQTFNFPRPTAFHRFIRVDFESFYGSEYYCPVSHIRVFGMNQMEAFKWEQKHAPKLAPVEGPSTNEVVAVPEKQVRESRVRRKEESARDGGLGELEELVHREASRADTTVSPKISDTTSFSESEGTGKQPRIDTSESIYASINRRLNALESNSSLIARYIEEQGKLTRSALTAIEQDWDEWRFSRESIDSSKWEQERMRQEDRLGKVISVFEQQRVALDSDRKIMAAQIRILADELNYERRRGLAQMVIMIVVIGLGVMSRSSVIEHVLKPVLAEARRRKSLKDGQEGPLTSLHTDLSFEGTPAVLNSQKADRRQWHRGTPRRPGTPAKKRPLSTVLSPSNRSFSTSDHLVPASPRPKSSLPGQGGPYRRLAQSAHLHQLVRDGRAEPVPQSPK